MLYRPDHRLGFHHTLPAGSKCFVYCLGFSFFCTITGYSSLLIYKKEVKVSVDEDIYCWFVTITFTKHSRVHSSSLDVLIVHSLGLVVWYNDERAWAAGGSVSGT